MFMESYRMIINDLKVTCNRQIFKNLTLLIRIQHKEYILLPLASIFYGVSNLKTRQIESVNFQYDKGRNKFFNRKIQLQLKLIYQTGKSNIKTYAINLNDFIIDKKGFKTKKLRVQQRLFQIQCQLILKSGDFTQSQIFRQSIIPQKSQRRTITTNNFQRVKSETYFDRLATSPNDKLSSSRLSNLRASNLIKNTIKTRQNNLINEQANNDLQTKQVPFVESIIKILQTDKQSDFLHKSNTNSVFSVQKSIFPLTISTVYNENLQKKLALYQSNLKNADKQLQNQKQIIYRQQKQIASLKNKIQHLIYQKGIILKQRQQDRLLFQTRDKDEKIKQRKDIDNLKRKHQNQLKQKQTQLDKIIQNRQIQYQKLIKQKQKQNIKFYTTQLNNQINELKDKIKELQIRLVQQNTISNQRQLQINKLYSFLDKQQQIILRLQSQLQSITIQNNELLKKSQQINQNPQNINTNYQKINKNSQKIQKNPQNIKKNPQNIQKHVQKIQKHVQKIKNKTLSHQNYSIQSQQKSIASSNIGKSLLIQLMDKRNQTYHQIILKLQTQLIQYKQQLQILQQQNQIISQQLEHKNKLLQQNETYITQLKQKLLNFYKSKFQTLIQIDQFNLKDRIFQIGKKLNSQKQYKPFRKYSFDEQRPALKKVMIRSGNKNKIIFQPISTRSIKQNLKKTQSKLCQIYE